MGEREPSEESAIDVDPVCGVDVTVTQHTQYASYAGQRFHFCCETCKTRFVQDPERYTASWVETM
jgi:YHS domain-containing protein